MSRFRKSEKRQETRELLEVINAVNGRTQTLAASTEEMAAASNSIVETANNVREVLDVLNVDREE